MGPWCSSGHEKFERGIARDIKDEIKTGFLLRSRVRVTDFSFGGCAARTGELESLLRGRLAAQDQRSSQNHKNKRISRDGGTCSELIQAGGSALRLKEKTVSEGQWLT